jgi:cardiolipin synthase C
MLPQVPHAYFNWFGTDRSRRGTGGLARAWWVLFVWLLLGVASYGSPVAEEPRLASPFAEVVQAARKRANDDLTRGNHVALLSAGEEALWLRLHLIRHAQASIDVQTFIWTNDECGRLLIYELVEAARRGVRVRILADHFASDQDPELVAFLATVHPNLQVRHYRPASSRLKASLVTNLKAAVGSFRAFNQRMHNKVMLVDEAVLVTGGRNVENTYFDYAPGLNFRDRDVLVIGPAVEAAVGSFNAFWDYRHSVPSDQLRDVSAVIAADTFARFPTRENYDFGPHFRELHDEVVATAAQLVRGRLRPVDRAWFISDEPGKLRDSLTRTTHVTRELREAIEQARESIVIQTPYLVLSKSARRSLRRLREERPGLSIRLSTNSFASTDNLMAYSGNYRLRNLYVEDLGLEIYEFKPYPEHLRTLFVRYDERAALAGCARRVRARICAFIPSRSWWTTGSRSLAPTTSIRARRTSTRRSD